MGSGGKGGGGGGRTPVEEQNTLTSKTIASFVELLGEGENVGLVDGLKSVFLDGTPVQNSDGSYNFNGIKWQQRTGTIDQPPLVGIPTAESEVTVNTQVRKDVGPVVRTVTNADLDAVRIRIFLPALYKVIDSGGNAGDIVAHEVGFRIEVREVGGAWVNPFQTSLLVLRGKTSVGYEHSYRVDLPKDLGAGSWELRVTRVSNDEDVARLNSDLYWAGYSEVMDEQFTYPWCHVVGVQVDTAFFGTSLPSRVYHVKGRIVPVPSNYDPETRTYTGLWNGTFKLAWTDNPAWCYRDLLLNTRYGLGKVMKHAQIDDGTLYVIAQYCDELVDDGFGGQEPRFTANLVINSQAEAYQVVNDMASIFRGLTFWSAGFLTLTYDAPKTPELIVTNANVEQGEFEWASTSLRARKNAVIVAYNSPGDLGKQALEIEQDNASIAKYGYRPKFTTAFGCVSRGQAKRMARWLLLTEQLETDVVVYRAGEDHAWVTPGTIVSVYDEDKLEVRWGGRAVEYSGTSVTLDDSPALGTPSDYVFQYLNSDLQKMSVPVLAQNGNVLTLGSSLPDDLDPNFIWALADSSTPEVIDVRVLTSKEVDPGVYEVAGVTYYGDKFNQIETGIDFDSLPSNSVPSGKLSAPTDVAAIFSTLPVSGSSEKVKAVVSWVPPSDARVSRFELQESRENGDWTPVIVTSGVSYEYSDLRKGTVLKWRVRSLAEDGKYSDWTTSLEFTATGRTSQSEEPTSFTAEGKLKAVLLSWVNPQEPSLKQINIYRGTTNDEAQATFLDAVTSNRYVDVDTGFGTEYFYWIEAELHDGPALNSDFVGPASASGLAIAGSDLGPDSVGLNELAQEVLDAISSAGDASAAALAAEQAQLAAETAKDLAEAAKDDAELAQGAAEQAVIDAGAHSDAAQASATAASGHASTAQSEASDAASSATAAEGSYQGALTQAGQASSSAAAAATSASDASGSASSAFTSEQNAATAYNSTRDLAVVLGPYEVGLPHEAWTNSAPATGTFPRPVVDSGTWVTDDSNFGDCWESSAGNVTLAPANGLFFSEDRCFLITYRFKISDEGTGAGVDVRYGFSTFGDNGTVAGQTNEQTASVVQTIAQGVVEFKLLIKPDSLTDLGSFSGYNAVVEHTAASTGMTSIVPHIRINAAGATDGTARIDLLKVEDITAFLQANVSAKASSDSASAASASATDAGDYASAAQTDRVLAETAKSNAEDAQTAAEVAQGIAVAAKNDAEGAASEAAEYSILSATAANASVSYNVVTNGTFRDGISGWEGDPEVSISYDADVDVSVKPTAGAMVLTAQSTTTNGQAQMTEWKTGDFPADSTFRVVFYASEVGNPTGTMETRLIIQGQKANGDLVNYLPPWQLITSSWDRYEYEAVLSEPVVAVRARMALNCSTNGVVIGDQIKVSDLFVRDITYEKTAESFASAAAGSASTASSEATNSETSAQASEVSYLKADTAHLSAASNNFILDGDFNRQDVNLFWSAGANGAIQREAHSSIVPRSAYSLKATCTNGSDTFIPFYNDVKRPMLENRTFKISGAYIANSILFDVQVRLYWTKSNGATGTETVTLSPTTSWDTFEVEITSPTDTILGQFAFCMSGAGIQTNDWIGGTDFVMEDITESERAAGHASSASTSASNAASSASTAAGASATAITARDAAVAVETRQNFQQGVTNPGFEIGTDGTTGIPKGWWGDSFKSDAFSDGTLAYRTSNIDPASDFASRVAFGAVATDAGRWWYLAKVFRTTEGQEWRVSYKGLLGQTTAYATTQALGPDIVGESDLYIHYLWYDADNRFISEDVTNSFVWTINNREGATVPADTWHPFTASARTTPANAAYIEIRLVAADANGTLANKTAYVDFAGNAHAQIDDVEIESLNGDVFEVSKAEWDGNLFRVSAAVSEAAALQAKSDAETAAAGAAFSRDVAAQVYAGSAYDNPIFSRWDGASPDGVSDWIAGSNGIIEKNTADAKYENCIRMDTNGVPTEYRPIVRWNSLQPEMDLDIAENVPGLHVEFEIEQVAGNWGGASIDVTWKAGGSGGSDGIVRVFLEDVLSNRNGIVHTVELSPLRPDNFASGSTDGHIEVSLRAASDFSGKPLTDCHLLVHRMNVRPLTTSAQAYMSQSAILDLEGNAQASLVFRAKQGGAVGEVEVVAGGDVINGSSSKVSLTGDEISLSGDTVKIGDFRNLLFGSTGNWEEHGWRLTSGAEVVTWTAPVSGSKILLLTEQHSQSEFSKIFDVLPDDEFRLTFYARPATNVVGQNVGYNRIVVDGQDANGDWSFVHGSNWESDTLGVWTFHDTPFVIPSGVVRMRVRIETGHTSGDVRLDDIRLEKKSGMELVVGGTLRSDNYVPQTSGWRIRKDDTSEFNNPIITRPLALARGRFLFTGNFTIREIWPINTGIRIGKGDVWRSNKYPLVVHATVLSGVAGNSGLDPNNAFWGTRAEVFSGARWNGFTPGNPQPSDSVAQDPAVLVTPEWATGTDQRAFLWIKLDSKGYGYFSSPWVEWVVYQVS